MAEVPPGVIASMGGRALPDYLDRDVTTVIRLGQAPRAARESRARGESPASRFRLKSEIDAWVAVPLFPRLPRPLKTATEQPLSAAIGPPPTPPFRGSRPRRGLRTRAPTPKRNPRGWLKLYCIALPAAVVALAGLGWLALLGNPAFITRAAVAELQPSGQGPVIFSGQLRMRGLQL